MIVVAVTLTDTHTHTHTHTYTCAGVLHHKSLVEYVYETSATDITQGELIRKSFSAKMRLRQRLASEDV